MCNYSVNANENIVTIHAATAGDKIVHLPRCRAVQLLLSGEPAFYSNVIDLNFRQFETRLFRLE